MGLWSNLVMIRGLGLRDPGSNPGNPIYQNGIEKKENKGIRKIRSWLRNQS